ncbi:Ubiquitin-activating enzyme E1 1 [Babesia sp. Xinjiang]|uniref:Ubiquitin-activating enzyme E1 1 n=1 Tax=Babesia sp. Xinjiang TaxID=462227 RepID=UPI000A22150E|nr:Ubiquitin-activating enzyme E1 1 [Babesia sp. Xinjiang]ORM41956.1 Ubiquitin-activating enzyme E1 1 [Babesia sp. Xinjiang]
MLISLNTILNNVKYLMKSYPVQRGHRIRGEAALTLLCLVVAIAIWALPAVKAGRWNNRQRQICSIGNHVGGRLPKIGDIRNSNAKNERTQLIPSDNYDNKFSRLLLVITENGLERLRQSRVLVVGASKLASEIITHLSRSGVGTICVWDSDDGAKEMAQNIMLLQTDVKIKILEREPKYAEENYDAVIFVDQPLQQAMDVNDIVRDKSKFIYTISAGVYGLVLSDFGDVHRVHARAERHNPEQQGTVISDGKTSVIEVSSNYGVDTYEPGDVVNISVTKYLGYSKARYQNDGDIIVITAKVLSVEHVDQFSVKLVIDINMKEWNKGNFGIKKVERPTNFTFDSLKTLVRRLLGEKPGWIELIKDLFKRTSVKPAQLIIAPAAGNSKHRSVVATAAALMKLGRKRAPSVDDETLGNCSVMDNSADEEVSLSVKETLPANFSTLTQVEVPAINSLVEAIKGLTGVFTPSEVIIVDRCDVFPSNGAGLSVEDARRHLEQANKCGYVVVGAGALGCEYLKMLARMGVEHVTILDNDRVDVSNLTRQSLFTLADVGTSKAEAAVKNLRLITNRNLKNYVAQNRLFDEDFHAEQNDEITQLILLSAVDNIHARLAIENYAIENLRIFVEAGIHGMNCSTSVSVPHCTDSYGSTVGPETLMNDHVSCSVKGIPRTIEDTVFYSMELFAWIFDQQHQIFNNFQQDPVGTLQSALSKSLEHFCNVANSIGDNAQFVVGLLNAKDWANRAYDTYFSIPLPLKNMLLDAMSNIKRRAVRSLGQRDNENTVEVDKLGSTLRLMIEEHCRKLEMTPNDGMIKRCLDAVDVLLRNPGIRRLFESGMNVELKRTSFNENLKDNREFVFAASNIRAHKFGICQKDMTTIMKVAKNVVPAISTTVGIAASMAMLEVYKAVSLLENMHLVHQRKMDELSQNVANRQVSIAKPNVMGGSPTLILNQGEASFFNKNKKVVSLRIIDYRRNRELSRGLINNYFNLSTMNYIPSCTSFPDIFEVYSGDALLRGVSLSFWDHIIVNDGKTNNASYGAGKPSDTVKGAQITIGELVGSVERLFDVKVEALYASGHIVTVSEDNTSKTLRDVFNFKGTGTIQLKAKDKVTSQPIGLPNIRYAIQS